MKKNISINISGIIFHIEEDAYEKLKGYLDSISRYFSSFDGSQEIIADIESRIAEIFLGKLDEDKQIITHEDVDSLIATMGSIADFQAVEEPEETFDQKEYADSDQSSADPGRKKLFRDANRKLIGGVCSGVAHYFNIDPIWIRLIFLALLLGSYGGILIVYIIMWIAVPLSFDLSEDKKLKKMYRDTDNKVIAGVSSGIANYFGVEVAVIRVLFVLFIVVGGTGLIAYIILWLILPEARSITDKVQMKGEPVTLSNIETNIKESLNVKEKDEENIFIKILLFPFRLISSVINGIGKALGPLLKFLVEFVRVAVGIFIVFIGIIIIFSTIIAFGATAGVISSGLWGGLGLEDTTIPLELMADTFPVGTVLAGLMTVVVPSLFMVLLGSSLIAKRIIFSTSVGWTLFAIFIVSIIVLSVNVPSIVLQFREDGTHEITTTYDIDDKTAILRLNEVDLEGYEVTTLQLRGYDGDELKLQQIFEAQGRSRRDAVENAKMITYDVNQEDSILYFDSNIQFKPGAAFRAQRLDMTLYIPYNQKFEMDYDLRYILRNTIYRYDYRESQIDDNTWIFNENGLECLTCSASPNYSPRSYRGEDYDRSVVLEEFQDVSVDGPFKVDFIESSDYKVLLEGRVADLDELDIFQDGNKVNIRYKDSGKVFDKGTNRGDVKVMVLTPYIYDIELSGACEATLDSYRQEGMKIFLSGASTIAGNIYIDELEAELTGASEMEIRGSGKEMVVDVLSASHLRAGSYAVRNADVEARAASTATVYVTNTLEIEERLASRVTNKGRARQVNTKGRSDDENDN